MRSVCDERPTLRRRLLGIAGFMVVLSGEIMTMPGLPKTQASNNIDIDADGNIVGLA